MAAIDTPDPPTVTMTDAPDAVSENPATKKSYRRKYRKIMVTFEQRMQQSMGLFRDEQKVADISQRLAEQTDQILQLLLDLNSMPQVPQRIRYNLDGVEDFKPVKAEEAGEYDEEAGHMALRKGRYQLQIGETQPYDYELLKNDVLKSRAFAPSKSYSTLAKSISKELLPPTPPTTDTESPDTQSGFLTSSQEDQYQRALDAFLRGEAPNPRGHVVSNGPLFLIPTKTGERNIEKEKEIQLKNPVSVYNWLRKHQPQVFLQDDDNNNNTNGGGGGGKPARATGARVSKRASNRDRTDRESIMQQEQELYDEDGIAMDVPSAAGGGGSGGASSRSKRKRDEDGGYRPKGGAARSSAKRKRDSEANVGVGVNANAGGRSRKKSSIG